jgi:hypothetical protein
VLPVALASSASGVAINIATASIRRSDAPVSPYTYPLRVRSELQLDDG